MLLLSALYFIFHFAGRLMHIYMFVIETKMNDVICSPRLFTDANHHDLLIGNLFKMRQNESLCDVTLTCGKTSFQVHKVVMAASSEYFQAMFTGGMLEEQKPNIALSNVDADSLSILVNYVYTGDILINEMNVQLLLETANLLQFLSAKSLCCEYIMSQLNEENCLDMFHFADTYHCADVLALSQTVFNKNWKKIIQSESFAMLKYDVFVRLISSDALQVKKESDVLRMILCWVEGQVAKRKNLLLDLLECVRWTFVSPKELNAIRQYPLLLSEKRLLQKIDSYLMPNPFDTAGLQMRESYKCWMYILGGEQSFLMEMKSCECFNDRDTKWNFSFSLHGPRTSFAAVVRGSRLYVMGGMRFGEKLRVVECYNHETGKWKKLSSLKKCLGDVKAAIIDDVIYVAGGSSEGEPACRYTEMYDESNNQWQLVCPMKSKRRRFGLCEFKRALYAFGGFQDSVGELSVCETYSPEDNAWQPITPMKTNRCDLGVTVLSGKIYVTGGVNSYAGSIATVEKYDPATDTWAYCEPLIHARGGHAMLTFFGRAVAIGGMNSYMQTCADAELYNEVTNEWSPLPLTVMPRSGGAGVILPYYCSHKYVYKERFEA